MKSPLLLPSLLWLSLLWLSLLWLSLLWLSLLWLSLLWLSLLWLLFASAALAAESAVVEGAKKEGALVFYTTMDIQNSKPLLDAFMKKYSFIKGDLVRLGGTAMVSRIMTEAQASANAFDVAVGISLSYT